MGPALVGPPALAFLSSSLDAARAFARRSGSAYKTKPPGFPGGFK